MGASVYHRLGYETMYHYEEYVRWPSRPRADGRLVNLASV